MSGPDDLDALAAQLDVVPRPPRFRFKNEEKVDLTRAGAGRKSDYWKATIILTRGKRRPTVRTVSARGGAVRVCLVGVRWLQEHRPAIWKRMILARLNPEPPDLLF